MASKYHITKDGRKAKKGLYYYMNRAKKRGTSKPGKGSVTDEALERSAKTEKIWRMCRLYEIWRNEKSCMAKKRR